RRSRTPLPDAAAGDKGRWSARFSGPRRSDGAWVQAILHETQRGARALGVGSAVHVAVIAVVSAMLVCAYLSIDPAWLHLRSEAAGVDQIGRNGADAAESALPARLHRTSDGIAIWGTLLTYAFVLSMFTLSSPFLPALGVIHPISRARRARVVWLATQVQEGAILIALLGVSVVVAACFAMLSGEDQREGLMLRAAAAVAAWAAMPLGRWTRLRCIESISTPTAALAPAADPASPRFLAASLLSAALVIGGAVLLGAIWQQSRDASAGERIVIATLSVGAIAAVRWLWLRALIRFHRRRDLPPS
ncbi:MAG TPA: hypothetical protein PKC43_14225, partial [Phycisphaerales bacterium]|nr:hypothetical protein [Phycisphaerales bacterium]HMP38590.1 hypothetical protein [Phycisphaerales bacterium]